MLFRSGAIAGDHISPLSSTTVMSTTSSGAYHHDHVITQLQYSVPALIGSLVAYTIAGLMTGFSLLLVGGVSLASGIAICFALLYYLNKNNAH